MDRELLELSEEDKLQAAMDVAEAVYFIHNLSNPVVHQVMDGWSLVKFNQCGYWWMEMDGDLYGWNKKST